MPPFATDNTFCASRDVRTKNIFARLVITREKQILTRIAGIRKKMGLTTHISEILKLPFGKKMPYIVMYLKLCVIKWGFDSSQTIK